ncbi:hypothetical protein VC841_27080 [Citrobacter freundii]|nr:hypothetical protein [Citrobacter freundii]
MKVARIYLRVSVIFRRRLHGISGVGWALLQIVGGDKLIIPFC